MAEYLARDLQGELDVVLARKLRAPGQVELALGSVDESGWTCLSEDAAVYGVTADYLAAENETQMVTPRQRRARYTPIRPPISPGGRIVIVADDMVCLETSVHFQAVGQFYQDFDQVDNDEVIEILKKF